MVKDLIESILTCLLIQLLCWQDNLDTWCISGVWDSVIQQADSSNNLSCWIDEFLLYITWIAYNQGS